MNLHNFTTGLDAKGEKVVYFKLPFDVFATSGVFEAAIDFFDSVEQLCAEAQLGESSSPTESTDSGWQPIVNTQTDLVGQASEKPVISADFLELQKKLTGAKNRTTGSSPEAKSQEPNVVTHPEGTLYQEGFPMTNLSEEDEIRAGVAPSKVIVDPRLTSLSTAKRGRAKSDPLSGNEDGYIPNHLLGEPTNEETGTPQGFSPGFIGLGW